MFFNQRPRSAERDRSAGLPRARFRPDETQQSHLNQRQSEILEKAAHLFCVKGYDSTSMSDIADAVGAYLLVEFGQRLARNFGIKEAVISLVFVSTDI